MTSQPSQIRCIAGQACALLWVLYAHLCLAAAATPANDMELKESLLAVIVNGRSIADFETVLGDADSGYYVSADMLKSARLRLPAVPPRISANREYYALKAIPGLIVRLDPKQQLLSIKAPPEAFAPTSLEDDGAQFGMPQPSEMGLFLNHDIQYIRNRQGQALSGLLETGLFSRLGILTSRFTSADLLHGGRILRLDTQFFRDYPSRKATLTIGDSISAGNSWGKQVYFAGVRWASNFSTQPAFVPYALPNVSGLAVQPSVVDIYVNNVKTMSRQVDTGPFSINKIPVISSLGNIQMVVTDVMGRQQVISQQYITTSRLLRKGTSEYAYEAGSPRQNLGRTSFGYSSFFLQGTHRFGITDALTIDGRMELGLQNRALSGGFTYALQPIGIVSAGAAAGFGNGKSGTLFYADISHPGSILGFSAHYQASSAGFRQLGLEASQQAPARIFQGEVSCPLARYLTVAAGYLQRDGRGEPSLRGPLASINLRLGRAYLTLGANYSTLREHRYGATVSLFIPLGERTMVSASSQFSNQTSQASYQIERSLPLRPGYGYRIRANTLDNDGVDAGFSYQTNQGTYTAEASRGSGQTGIRLWETGSLVFLQGRFARSRWLNDSFAIVDVPGQKGVDVLVNNQVAGRTNRGGKFLVPWLVPYERNIVRIDDRGVPLDTTLDLGERIAVPYPRSGLYLRFEAERMKGATIALVTPNGQPVPVGALVSVNGKQNPQQIGYYGEVFVREMEYPAELVVRWDKNRCRAMIGGTAPKQPLPRIGPVTLPGRIGMNTRTLICLAAVWLAAAGMAAAQTCTVSTAGVAFGNYQSIQNQLADSSGTITVTCAGQGNQTVSVSISLGLGGGLYTGRILSSGNSSLRYNLYLNTARTQVWGSGSSGTYIVSDAIRLTGGHATRNYTVYGRIPPGQTSARVGSYLDNLAVSLTFSGNN